MRSDEALRAGVFLFTVVAIYVLCAWILLSFLRQRADRSAARADARRPATAARRIGGRITLGLGAAGLVCMAYGRFVEPFWPQVERVRIRSPKVAAGAAPLRIVQLSDIHSDARARLERRLPQIVADLEPDVIVFTGDSINGPEGLPIFRECLSRLAALAPTYVVKGNWDVSFWSDLDLFTGTGATELDGDSVTLAIRGTRVSFAGVAAFDAPRLTPTLERMPDASLNVVLYHFPIVLSPRDQAKADLVCTGHVHGGQIALPYYGALVTLSAYGKEYERGLYRTGDTWLYVNRGIGMEGGWVPRVRFCARPEITLFEIGPAD